jgi:hypothetical protein
MSEVFQNHIRDGIGLQIEIAPSSSGTFQIFESRLSIVLIPMIEAYEEFPGSWRKPFILCCVNWSAHMADSMSENLANQMIFVVTHPPHT